MRPHDDPGAPSRSGPASGPFVWTDLRVREALGPDASDGGGAQPSAGRSDAPDHEGLRFSGVVTDSRGDVDGALFVALVGERFDGHGFVEAVAGKGARGAVVDRHLPGLGEFVQYLVPDTLVGLGRLARHWREAHPARVVGITGSAGKTGTKEFLREAVATSYRTHATAGNLNNRIGLPLTVLGASDDAEVLVLEMGTNEPGEIATLADIALPEVAVLTTVSESHLDGLGNLAGVLTEKLDLVRHLRPGGVAIVGSHPESLGEAAREAAPPGVDVRVAGTGRSADEAWRAGPLSQDAEGRWRFACAGVTLQLARPGRHEIENAAMALAAADALGVDRTAAAAALAGVGPGPMRGEVLTLGSVRVLVDCYNANPQSTAAALRTLEEWPGTDRRVAVLGSMLELGDRSAALHDRLLLVALQSGLDHVVATGAFAEAASRLDGSDPRVIVVPDPADAASALETILDGTEVVLLKGSRGVRLERLLPGLRDRWGGG